ncbi:hypothetical protein [Methylobacterium sp. ID0610]|uniref:hypothetical protein n=1 Tax=Methylobacterium carpenticola TaxID=3344827 RepID=UPI00369B5F5D
MALTLQPAYVPASTLLGDAQIYLVFAEEHFVCSLTRFDDHTNEGEAPCQYWFLEAGLGPCIVTSAEQPVFTTIDDAKTWLVQRLKQ